MSLSRRTVRVLADVYVDAFKKYPHTPRGATVFINTDALYACVYENDGAAWLLSSLESKSDDTALRMFILKLHTGESVNGTTWTLADRANYGQARLLELCTAIMRADERFADDESRAPLRSALELDGYAFRDGRLLRAEGETQDVEEERGELAQLYVDLGLPNRAIVEDCLTQSERQYNDGGYRDCIGNARHYLEQILRDVAETWSQRPGVPALVIPENQPAAGPCRNYLQQVGVLTDEEREAFRRLHFLLSETGGHPSLPEREAARVFRRLATSMAFYILLRYQAMR